MHSQLVHLLYWLPLVIGASMSYGFDSYGDDSSGDETSGLAGSILASATSIGSELILANANPTNAAIISGQNVSTPTLVTGSPTTATASISSSMFLVFAVIGVIIFLLVRR